MSNHTVFFEPAERKVLVPAGTLLVEAARLAGVEIGQPCGGQGRCGRCMVRVVEGKVRRRSILRLSPEDLDQGFALACQTVIEQDVRIFVPPQEGIERRLTTDRTVAEIKVPEWYFYDHSQTIRRFNLTLTPPSMDDQRDDLSRLKTGFKKQYKIMDVNVSLPLIKRIAKTLRQNEWEVTAIFDRQRGFESEADTYTLVDLVPGHYYEADPLWGAAVDIGTTTVTLWLVNLVTGDVIAQASEYNGQIIRGEDVISRIVYSSKDKGDSELQSLVVKTINGLFQEVCRRARDFHVKPEEIIKVTISGNSTMIHLLLGIPAVNIRLSPFITTVNEVPIVSAHEIGLKVCPDAIVDCLPGVASYVGSDITAGVFASGIDNSTQITLFMDVGTNGEIVLGSRDWLVSCACSAGPAFEGAGVVNGMRATTGAIEEVWINGETHSPSYRVIGGGKPKGICGSGLISLLAELFMTRIIDKAGNLNSHLDTPRIRNGEHGLEYVVAWASEAQTGEDIAITHVDIDNLIRAKGAIYAGYTILAESVGVPMGLIEQMLIGGSFGKYINVEKAIQIGLLPDLSWDRFEFLGNTSVRGAYYALLDFAARERIKEIAARMTYIELSADNTFYEAFTSALFLPHTDLSRFPTIADSLARQELTEVE